MKKSGLGSYLKEVDIRDRAQARPTSKIEFCIEILMLFILVIIN
jgi:hypothetical protein